ncbi:MAG: hypothetical protein LUC48_00115 [Clostridiales bacterium]|nr:hypothetical protein [Clostridiales bacterium]
MSEARKNDLIYTIIGVAIMVPIMTTFNKYLVYSQWMEYPLTTPAFWQQVGIGICQRLPVVFPLQFFVVQNYAARKTEEHTHPDDSWVVKSIIRVGFSILILCPVLSLYSNLILVIEGNITSVAGFINNWIPKMVQNWCFAYFAQVFVAGPLNKHLFGLYMKHKMAKAAK